MGRRTGWSQREWLKSGASYTNQYLTPTGPVGPTTYARPGQVGAEKNGQPVITNIVTPTDTGNAATTGYHIDEAWIAANGTTLRDIRVHGNITAGFSTNVPVFNFVNVDIQSDRGSAAMTTGIRFSPNIPTNATSVFNFTDCTFNAVSDGHGLVSTDPGVLGFNDPRSGEATRIQSASAYPNVIANFLRCDFRGWSKATFGGSSWQTNFDSCTIRDEWPFWTSATNPVHKGTVFINGSNCTIRRSWLAPNANPQNYNVSTNIGGFDPSTQTGTLMQYTGGAPPGTVWTNIVLESNYLTGGYFTLRMESSATLSIHLTVRNNVWGPYPLASDGGPGNGDDYTAPNPSTLFFPAGSWVGNIRGDKDGNIINPNPVAGQVDSKGRRLLIPAPAGAQFE